MLRIREPKFVDDDIVTLFQQKQVYQLDLFLQHRASRVLPLFEDMVDWLNGQRLYLGRKGSVTGEEGCQGYTMDEINVICNGSQAALATWYRQTNGGDTSSFSYLSEDEEVSLRNATIDIIYKN